MLKRWLIRILVLVAVSPMVFAALYGSYLNKDDNSAQWLFVILMAHAAVIVLLAWDVY